MSAPAAISGDFATYKHVQGRKMLQLVIEVPAEMASAVFAALGTPGSGEAIPVALARLASSPATVSQPETVRKERRAFTDMPYAQQAAIRCQEPSFQQYVKAQAPTAWDSMARRGSTASAPEIAAQLVRDWCRVESRSEIVKGTQAGDNWEHIEAAFYAEQHGRRA